MLFRPGENCWQLVTADRISYLIDGEDYYRSVAEACESARQAIYILGWDVDSRIRLRRDHDRESEAFGDFLDRLAHQHPNLHIYILEWDFAMLYSLEREAWTRASMGWLTHERVHFELDDNHPVGASHHQKIVVIDDRLAFAGGFDLASCRWDTSEHRPDHPKRNDSGTSYGPVHDVQMLVAGEAAQALGRLARQRWERATGEQLPDPVTTDGDPWPSSLSPDLEQARVAILRTEPEHDGRAEIREVERFYCAAIEQARSSIYIENQYLTSHRIGSALEQSLRRQQGPEIVLVQPKRCPGWLEQETMGALRQRLLERLYAADEHQRLLVCYPERRGLESEVIIVHSKVLVVDETLLTVGSANLSNRSMGFDTECNLAMAADEQGGTAAAIAGLRNRLLAEHLGTKPATVAEELEKCGSLLATIERLNNAERSLKKLPMAENSALLETLSAETIVDPEQPADIESIFSYFGLSADQPSCNHKTDIRRQAWRLFALTLGAVVLALLWRGSPLQQYLTLDNLLAAADALRENVLSIPIVLVIFVVGSCLMVPVNLLILATALSFGSVKGFALALMGSLLGGLVSYLLGRWLGREVVRKLAGDKLNRLSRKLARRGWLAVAVLRMVPIAPFTLVNMAAGVSHISTRSFLVGTAIGLCPGILAIMVFEEGLERVLRNPGWETVLLALIALGCAGLVLLVGQRWLRQQDEGQDD